MKKNKKGAVLLLFVFNCLLMFAQKSNEPSFGYGHGFQTNYTFREANQFGLGWNYMLYKTRNFKTANFFCVSIDVDAIFKKNFTSPNLRLSVEHLFWTKSKIGLQYSLSLETNSLSKLGIDAKIGISYQGAVFLNLGYNFFRLTPTQEMSLFSLGVNFRLNWAVFDFFYIY